MKFIHPISSPIKLHINTFQQSNLVLNNHIITNQMGAICQSKQQASKNYTTKSATLDASRQSQKIKITTKNVNKTNEGCLLLFIDRQCNVRTNQFLKELKSTIGSKLQDYLDLQLKGRCMNPGDCLILDIKIDGLKFNHVALLCINLWQEANKGMQDPLQEDIQHAFDSLNEKKLTTLCMTVFNSQFGIPTNIGIKTISRAVLNKIKDFSSISIVCLKQDQQNKLIQVVRKQETKILGDRNIPLPNSIKSEFN